MTAPGKTSLYVPSNNNIKKKIVSKFNLSLLAFFYSLKTNLEKRAEEKCYIKYLSAPGFCLTRGGAADSPAISAFASSEALLPSGVEELDANRQRAPLIMRWLTLKLLVGTVERAPDPMRCAILRKGRDSDIFANENRREIEAVRL